MWLCERLVVHLSMITAAAAAEEEEEEEEEKEEGEVIEYDVVAQLLIEAFTNTHNTDIAFTNSITVCFVPTSLDV
jgi:hypothetical protein